VVEKIGSTPAHAIDLRGI